MDNDEVHQQKILSLAENDCYNNNNNYNYLNNSKLCELIFDGLMCWGPTPAGTLASQSCSTAYIKATEQSNATRQCDKNGEWEILNNLTYAWTNYTQCGQFYIETNYTIDDQSNIYLKWIPIIKNTSVIGYIISLITLIIALFIFIYIKRLHCSRNILHINLFLTFIMRAIMSLLKDALFIKGTAFSQDTIFIDGEPNFLIKNNYSWGCKAIIIMRHYFILSNYMFFLMEGAYLHNLMFLNFFTDNKVTIYCFIGWGLPLFFILLWVIFKSLYEDIYCWTRRDNLYISWIIEIPIGATVVINFILFVTIVRILFVKLTSMYIQQRRLKYRKLVRSTLILVPLFGIPYIISLILSFYVNENQTLEIVWLFFDQTFTAFQGVLASLIYCILNSEVQIEIKQKYLSLKDRNNKEPKRNRTISLTQQFIMSNYDEFQENPQDSNNYTELLSYKK